MEQETGNKIIAEFMGGKWEKDDYDAYGYHWELGKQPTIHSSCWWSANALQYHTSWDWLMPVVEKIEAIHHIYEGSYINVRISQGYVEIEGTRKRIFKNTSIEGSKIKAVWLAVVEFINWYNNQKVK